MISNLSKFLILSLLFLSSEMYAQNAKGDFTVSPQIGLNVSNYYSFQEPLNNTLRLKYNAGVVLNYFFSDDWTIRTGAIYDPKGSIIENTSKGDVTERVDYIAVPVHASWNWNIDNENSLFLNFGPTLGFLISAEAEAENGEVFDFNDITRKTDIGIGIGVGYTYYFAPKIAFFVQIQSYTGIMPITKEPILLDGGDYNIRHTSNSINAGLTFKL